MVNYKSESEKRDERDEEIRKYCNIENKKAIDEINREKENNENTALDITSIISIALGVSILTNMQQCSNTNNLRAIIEQTNPNQIHLKYVNNDSLPDLVYKTGEIFLQTKEGNFVSYDSVRVQEKRKIDSIYQAKEDSIKKMYVK